MLTNFVTIKKLKEILFKFIESRINEWKEAKDKYKVFFNSYNSFADKKSCVIRIDKIIDIRKNIFPNKEQNNINIINESKCFCNIDFINSDENDSVNLLSDSTKVISCFNQKFKIEGEEEEILNTVALIKFEFIKNSSIALVNMNCPIYSYYLEFDFLLDTGAPIEREYAKSLKIDLYDKEEEENKKIQEIDLKEDEGGNV